MDNHQVRLGMTATSSISAMQKHHAALSVLRGQIAEEQAANQLLRSKILAVSVPTPDSALEAT